MTTSADIQILDQSGAPVKVADDVRATLSPTQITLLDAVQQAAHAERVATTAHAAATKRVTAAVKAHNTVMADRDKVLPRLTQQDLLRQVAAAHGQR